MHHGNILSHVLVRTECQGLFPFSSIWQGIKLRQQFRQMIDGIHALHCRNHGVQWTACMHMHTAHFFFLLWNGHQTAQLELLDYVIEIPGAVIQQRISIPNWIHLHLILLSFINQTVWTWELFWIETRAHLCSTTAYHVDFWHHVYTGHIYTHANSNWWTLKYTKYS